jgi:hypothetical protein
LLISKTNPLNIWLISVISTSQIQKLKFCLDLLSLCPDLLGFCLDLLSLCPNLLSFCLDLLCLCPDLLSLCLDLLSLYFDLPCLCLERSALFRPDLLSSNSLDMPPFGCSI